jgi:flavin reductase (DIM6/NTAB) family NADH-FMN oxidoreductase RutF
MSPRARHVHFDFSALSARNRYKLLVGTVIPRPIAFVTTVDERGRVNAAPFSFFNCLSADPPIVAIGVENHDDMTFKDAARNIRRTQQFTVNIVDDAMVEGINICAVPFPPDVDEPRNRSRSWQTTLSPDVGSSEALLHRWCWPRERGRRRPIPSSASFMSARATTSAGTSRMQWPLRR